MNKNKLLRTTGPITYRLVAVHHDFHGPVIGRRSDGNSLREDIEDVRSTGMRPLYSIFVRPKPFWPPA